MLKKILLGLFATTVSASSLAIEKWSVGTVEDNGRPIIIRVLSKIPENISSLDYPNMIAITWNFKSNSGMPSPSEKELMNELEDSVSELVESKRQALLTVVVTGNEVCEWQFYAKDQDKFMRLLNQALSGKQEFPIQVSMQKDSDWGAYKQFTIN